LNDIIHHLFIYHKVQLSIFPEFISFLKGNKKILRIVIDNNEKLFNNSLFLSNNIHVKEAKLYSSKQKNSFGSLVASINSEDSDNYSEVRMFSISKFKDELIEFEKAELYGDIEKAGEFLGYPICCIKNIYKINDLKDLWATFYLNDYEKMNKTASIYTNRFPITWGGVSIVGELFPCSLSCNNAIEYGRNLYNDVKSFGFNEIHKTIIDHAQLPIYINPDDGAISKFKKNRFNPILFS